MFLNVFAVFTDDFIANKTLFVITVLVIIFLKGQVIIDVYMEMSSAPPKWRILLLSYVVVLPLILSAIYLWSL
jgi:cytochrome c oxidase subunit IV